MKNYDFDAAQEKLIINFKDMTVGEMVSLDKNVALAARKAIEWIAGTECLEFYSDMRWSKFISLFEEDAQDTLYDATFELVKEGLL